MALFRTILVVVLTGYLGILGASPAAGAAARPGADLSVGLDAVGSLLGSGAYYTVSVTNSGQQAVSSRTTWVVFGLPQAPTEVNATATLVASTPTGTNVANNSASVECHYEQEHMGFPPSLWNLVC